MASSTLLERGSSAVAPFSNPSQGFQAGTLPSGSPASANWCVLPRCTVEFEKTSNGCKIHCRCDDEVARGTLQNLCRMLADGLCSCCCTCNGIPCCQCNFTVGICKCEYTKDGCTISCISGDKACCASHAKNDSKMCMSETYAKLNLSSEQRVKLDALHAEYDKAGCTKEGMDKFMSSAKGFLSKKQFATLKTECARMHHKDANA